MKIPQFKIIRCRMAGVEAVEAQTRHTFSRHTHDQYGIGVVYRGAQKSLSGRGMVEAGPGDTITVNPGEVHDGAPIGDAGRSWRILYFDPALIAEAVDDISEGRTKAYEFSRPVIRDARVADRFRQIFSIMTAGDNGDAPLLRQESLLLLLADVMCEQHGFNREQSIPMAILKVKSLIDDDPAAPLMLSDLARESGLSQFQVLRGFAKATGLTPHAYLVQRRIHRARHLIVHGMPLADAAAASGFADQSHMTRIFIRKYGISPGAYANAVI